MTEIKNIALKDLHNNTGFEIESGRVNANPRVIRDAQYKNLLQSLRESNLTDIMPLKVFEHDGKYIVIGGNMRLRALRELKAESVDCILIPQTYTADMLNKAIIIDNSTHGDWDMDMLANEWNADMLSVWGIELPEYKEESVEGVEAQEDDFDEEKDPIEKRAAVGDIWQLGQHRLLCGDSTDKANIELLMNGEKAQMVFTDPPYGMFLDTNYDGMFANDDTRAFDTGKRFEKVKGDNDDFKPELINTIFDNFGYCSDIFVWGADYFSELIPNRKDGSWVVWDKRCSEEMDKVAGNTFELCWSKNKHKRMIARIEWSGFHGMNGIDSGKRCHPTQKPVKLIEFFVKHWGDKTESIVDLYGGSGSTLIACEQLGRKCYMMELDPHYCDVIIARWEKLTGNKATLIK